MNVRHAAPILIALASAWAIAEPPPPPPEVSGARVAESPPAPAQAVDPTPPAQTSEPPAAPIEPVKVDAELIAEVVAQLGDDDYATREQAQRRLEALPAETMAFVLPHYQRADDLEVRMRLERYARGYFERYVFPEHAERLGWPTFLGIAMTTDNDGVVEVAQVIGGTAAAAAGLKVGDRVVGLQGNRLPVGDTTLFIGRTIRAVPPGGPLRLTVERDGKTLDVIARLMPATDDQLRNLEQIGETERDRLFAAREQLKRRWWDEAFLKGKADLPAEGESPEGTQAP